MHREVIQAPATRWFRRRWVTVTAGLLILVLVLAVIADVALTRYVKHGVVQALRCATGDGELTPDVSLGGPPVLVELATGELDQVTISGLSTTSVRSLDGRDARAGSSSSTIPPGQLTVTLRGLGLDDPPSVRSAQASVLMRWDGLAGIAGSATSELAGATLGAQDGLLAVTLKDELAGEPVKVLAALEAGGDTMTVTPESVVIGGRTVGLGLVSLFAGDLLKNDDGTSRLAPRTVDLDLPDGTSLRSVAVRPGGLAMDLSVDPSTIRDNASTGRNCRI
ncbi:DUF2993 domain-containing protein [Kineosporia sp. J2-2]|uniref:DUF2993 domain-containing protein n=1 Tax=Kineosporia corallincola TaxID=2835133 RepID=A0ABS5TSI3_9ACTN|nr:DUF2993 domain-containing protein [Kineosporia corallincola]MBT0773759.1 DUF2993 domain-containing protein [Kineosporia corallincola]